MDERADNLIRNWQRRNIQGTYCQTTDSALEKILGIIPGSASVGISGSMTLDQLGVVKHLESRGNKVFNPYKPGISRQENLEIRRQGSGADYYLASPNAISEKGELVFFSAYGNRVSGVSYADNVVAVSGINKVVASLDEALKRAREYATPLNCKRLNWNTPCFQDGICRREICLFPEHKRMCCQILIIEAEVTPERLKVVLIGETLGF